SWRAATGPSPPIRRITSLTHRCATPSPTIWSASAARWRWSGNILMSMRLSARRKSNDRAHRDRSLGDTRPIGYCLFIAKFPEPAMTVAYDNDNIFAKILRGELPSHKLYEDDATFAFMDIMPRGDGHCLVIPKKPSRNILDVDAESLAAVAATTQKLARAVMKAFSADGVT